MKERRFYSLDEVHEFLLGEDALSKLLHELVLDVSLPYFLGVSNEVVGEWVRVGRSRATREASVSVSRDSTIRSIEHTWK